MSGGRGSSTGITEEDVADFISQEVSGLFDRDGDTGVRTESEPGTDEDVLQFVINGIVVAEFFPSAGTINFGNKPGSICVFETNDDSGRDWCNHQVGNLGSAFSILKKSLGTIANPLPLTDGEKIGGRAFQAFNGTNNEYISAELAAFTVGNQNATEGGAEVRMSITEDGTDFRFTSQIWLDDGDIEFGDYPQSRDDGWTDRAHHGRDAQGGMDQSRILVPGQVVAFVGPEDDLNDTTDFEQVLSISMPGDLPAGRYEIEAKALVSIDATNSDYESRLVRGSVQLGKEWRREGKDAAGVGTAVDGDNSGTDQSPSMNLSKVEVLPANSTETYSYEHRATANNVEATCFDLNLRIVYLGP